MSQLPLYYIGRNDRFSTLYKVSLDLVQEFSLDTLLEKIAKIALEQVNASFAAVGTLDESGALEKFVPVGMTRMEIEKIPHPPQGKGVLGELMHSPESIRVRELTRDSRHSGFPPFHPKMKSFLGVPITVPQCCN